MTRKETDMRRIILLGGLIAVGGLAAVVAQQQQQPRPPLPDAIKVKDNLWVITSSTPGPEFTGGNTGIFVTDSGVILVDTKLSGYGPTILEKAKKINDYPVTTCLKTNTTAVP